MRRNGWKSSIRGGYIICAIPHWSTLVDKGNRSPSLFLQTTQPKIPIWSPFLVWQREDFTNSPILCARRILLAPKTVGDGDETIGGATYICTPSCRKGRLMVRRFDSTHVSRQGEIGLHSSVVFECGAWPLLCGVFGSLIIMPGEDNTANRTPLPPSPSVETCNVGDIESRKKFVG